MRSRVFFVRASMYVVFYIFCSKVVEELDALDEKLDENILALKDDLKDKAAALEVDVKGVKKSITQVKKVPYEEAGGGI